MTLMTFAPKEMKSETGTQLGTCDSQIGSLPFH